MALMQFDYRLGPSAKPKYDPQVESLIDAAGRDLVMARAKAIGWGVETPPKWVWVEIAKSIIRGKLPAKLEEGNTDG